MKEPSKHMQDEPDIGSGEKNPGQKDTEKMIEQVGTAQQKGKPASPTQPPDKQEAGTAPKQ